MQKIRRIIPDDTVSIFLNVAGDMPVVIGDLISCFLIILWSFKQHMFNWSYPLNIKHKI